MNVRTIWGRFSLSRQLINSGVGFVLKECPNALNRLATNRYPLERDAFVMHLKINKKKKQQKFIKEITEFMEDHYSCLLKMFKSKLNQLESLN